MTSSQVAAELQAGGEEVVDFFTSLDPVAAHLPVTASGHPGGRPWSPKDHLAHLVQREFDFLPIARRVIAQESYPVRLEHRGSTAQERTEFVNRENQAAIEDRKHATFADLLAEFVALRSELASLVQGLSSDDLTRDVAVTAGRYVAAGVLLGSSDLHAKAHLQTLRGGLIDPSIESRIQ